MNLTLDDLRVNMAQLHKDAALFPTIARHKAGILIKEWALEDELQNALYKLPLDILEMYNTLPVVPRASH